ncbi:hypothetical protein [Brevundimonas subvibrioides]|uniref:Uncharacterized protein n=1 Tax=Brevundimonas subvibrioides (strain ATCC 15264 / DSM 4735 / LMG 14903 / NBRC 16000 / CB 81) TaxID=633149 RepID=D9QNN9_BRESC|nr:hypothetical protein [Brevundimonas subvibrioides]ADL02274.1 hypothetical protein Bresu_2968 [Brevundimonas subvibrioides ATCC 15264]
MFLMIFFSVAAILALAGVLVFVATSGRLSADTRRKIELGLIVVFYPICVFFMSWRAFDSFVQQHWVTAVLSAGLAVFLGADGYQKLRSRLLSDRVAT